MVIGDNNNQINMYICVNICIACHKTYACSFTNFKRLKMYFNIVTVEHC